jgi:hypothetical protein
LKKILPLILLLVMGLPRSVEAQNAVHFEELVIEIWPEYDQPGVLVIYRGMLAPEMTLPAQLSFQIPADAGQPNAVAVRTEEGTLVTVDYERIVRGEWAEITFLSTSREIQLEYYDSSIQKQDAQRSFQFEWKGDYTSDQTTIRVQSPVEATEMQISPPFSGSFRGSDGLLYYTTTLENLQEERNFPIEIRYQKEGDFLSVEDKPVQPSVPLEPGMLSGIGKRDILPWALGTLGVLLIIAAAVIYWHFGTNRQPVHAPETSAEPSPGREQAYCTQCGYRVAEEDRFCRHCGTKLG